MAVVMDGRDIRLWGAKNLLKQASATVLCVGKQSSTEALERKLERSMAIWTIIESLSRVSSSAQNFMEQPQLQPLQRTVCRTQATKLKMCFLFSWQRTAFHFHWVLSF
ncbi:hypothetical protein EGW08_001751 [Elysia chlorotica]|uniref:Uncharacterized protein n=1 Tax=Elysia chlorotica TaxID=188477 RepID=A0A3S1A4L4_ELYCH|nr:hypothetical protein EGW08_001751 [Elysia chlorotica]